MISPGQSSVQTVPVGQVTSGKEPSSQQIVEHHVSSVSGPTMMKQADCVPASSASGQSPCHSAGVLGSSEPGVHCCEQNPPVSLAMRQPSPDAQ